MADSPDTLQTTPLHSEHLRLGARMMAFGGFDMPVQYDSIIDEHNAVRNDAGLFDVSHMGEVHVTGPQALDFVQHLVTNDASALYDGKAMYTVMCTDDGGIVDDLLVYRRGEESYMLVINAANIDGDVAWMRAHNPMDADLHDASDEYALLALQGPKSFDIAAEVTDVDLSDLKFYHFVEATGGDFLGCDEAILSRTGYTGERGLELYVPAEDAVHVWTTLMQAGAGHGLKAAGLGARDTLRLEAGYCLYGNDISRDTNPYEAGLGWVVKPDASDFVGRDALLEVKAHGPSRKLVGFVAEGRGIPRHDYAIVTEDGDDLGVVTSGTQSPVLQKGIGLGYVPNEPDYTEEGATLHVKSRRRSFPVTVASPPFHEK